VTDFTQYSDKELITLIVDKKEIDAFGVLYDRYIRVIFNKVLATFGHFENSEDITHDIFLKIFLRLKTYKGEAAFSTWVYSITNHHIIDIIRTEQKKNEFDADVEGISSLPEEPDDETLLNIKTKKLLQVLEQLNSEERLILIFKYRDELSIKEIMEAFGINESTAKMRISRAKKKAYKIYKEQHKNIEV
jgi:RNA polymerase sigma-70 factor (ECF subfamily)